MALISPLPAYSMGSASPPSSTCVPPGPPLRLDPKMEMNPPGAMGSGACAATLAALTTPPALMAGADAFAASVPVIAAVPARLPLADPATTPTVAAPPAPACGIQVAVQLPPPKGSSGAVASPPGKYAAPEPASSGFPQ